MGSALTPIALLKRPGRGADNPLFLTGLLIHNWLVVIDNRLVIIDNGLVIINNRLVIIDNRLVVIDNGLVIIDNRLVVIDNGLVIIDNRLVIIDNGLVIIDNGLVIIDNWLVIIYVRLVINDVSSKAFPHNFSVVEPLWSPSAAKAGMGNMPKIITTAISREMIRDIGFEIFITKIPP